MGSIRGRGFSEYKRVDEALRIFLKESKARPLEAETVQVTHALNRVLAEDVFAEVDVPHFDRSAVDGYAVRSEDVFGASGANPVVLNLIGSVEIGEVPTLSVEKSETAKIATGAPLPRGVDSVVMLEYAEEIGKGKVEILRASTPEDNVSKVGEDVRKGDLVLGRGTTLRPQDIGILVAVGRTTAQVVRKPRVAVLSSGNELIDPGSKPESGKIIDVNRPAITAAVEAEGATPLDLGIVGDRLEEIERRIRSGLAQADLLIVTGGTSVGTRDLVPDAINRLGRGIVVHGVSMRPGRPTALGLALGKPVLLLPGFPVAALLAFNVFAKPLINIMSGLKPKKEETVRARALRRIPSGVGMRSYVRVTLKKTESGYVVEPLRVTGSGIISSMVKANGLIVIPEGKEGIEEGEETEVILLRPLED